MNRIFISYRSSDGKKDAARLAADLNERFGEQLVFYDKQDLLGGTSWRDAIKSTLGSQPVVLVLVTPDLLAAQHPEGGRRIDHEDDPIRGELLTARQSGAVILPLLTDGTVMPMHSQLPAPLQFLSENHARPLRTDDWNADLQRIVDDLRAHRIVPATAEPPAIPPLVTSTAQAVVRRVQRGLMVIGGVMVVLVGIRLLLPEQEKTDPASAADPPPLHAAAPSKADNATAAAALKAITPGDTAGVWWSIDEQNRALRVLLTVQADSVELQTDAFPVSWYPHWQDYANGVRDMGLVVNEVRYVGQGKLSHVMGVPRVEVTVRAVTGDGRGPLDTGAVVLDASTDGRELTGQLWSNGGQNNTPLRLVRRP
jgi:hypothetical protein